MTKAYIIIANYKGEPRSVYDKEHRDDAIADWIAGDGDDRLIAINMETSEICTQYHNEEGERILERLNQVSLGST